MIKDIVIGTKQSNIVTQLFQSNKAKFMFGICMIILYRNNQTYQVGEIFEMIILSVIMTNLIYMPVRYIKSRRISFFHKMIFTITATLLWSVYFTTIQRLSVVEILYFCMLSILLSFFITSILVRFFKGNEKIGERFESACFKWNLTLNQIDQMEGHEFEAYCANLLERNGFTEVQVTQGSGDHGIDVLAVKETITYAIQCKRYKGTVGNGAIQEAYTGKSLYGADIAVVLTNAEFSKQAEEEAKRLGVRLWGREELVKLMKQ